VREVGGDEEARRVLESEVDERWRVVSSLLSDWAIKKVICVVTHVRCYIGSSDASVGSVVETLQS
jgi:hypothetical protein